MEQIKVFCSQTHCPDKEYECVSDRAILRINTLFESSFEWLCCVGRPFHFDKIHADIARIFDLKKTSLMQYRLFREING